MKLNKNLTLTSLSRSLELSASLGATDDVVSRSDARPLSSDVPGSFANDVIEFWKEKKIQKKNHELTPADNSFPEWKKENPFRFAELERISESERRNNYNISTMNKENDTKCNRKIDWKEFEKFSYIRLKCSLGILSTEEIFVF